LFYGRRELDDNTATVASLEILANDTIDLKEETEVHEISSDSEDAGKGKRRDEGFGGTLLGRTDTRSSSPPKPVPAPTERACGTCTFSNPVNITICGVCEQPTE
jgi:ubiquitin carboxyl-terminal hydrolase 48